MAAMQLHWDIFCRVIDNYGDIGICWRLARQLSAEHGRRVRLWVDDLRSLQPLCPSVDPSCARQFVDGVEIGAWEASESVEQPAEVVIEAFACDLPNAYLQRMAQAVSRPCWINLEYLTAESWAEGCHGMASPHPSLPLVKYFFFPGFSPNSGGLLRERDWQSRFAPRADPPRGRQLEISLFCYETAPVGPWLDALAAGDRPAVCHVPPGQPLAAVQRHLGGKGPWQLGNARIEPIPFLPMDAYDALLARCDINFVRGEDSFVRAQWAGKPFVWQAYRQEDEAHLDKLAAFLDRYLAGRDDDMAAAVRGMSMAWNVGDGVGDCWPALLARLEGIGEHNRAWARQLATRDDLASSLVKFCAARV